MISKTLMIAGVTLLVLGVGRAVFKNDPVRAKVAAQTHAVKPLNSTALTTALDKTTKDYTNLDLGVAVVDLNTDETYVYGEKEPYYGASTTKVLVASLYLREAEQGKRKLSDKVGGKAASAQITAMIVQSDNEAWSALRTALGYANLNKYAASLGMSSFVAQDNLVDTTDMAKLLQQLAEGKLLDKYDTTLLLGLMKKSIRNNISPALPSTATAYHKAGWLDDRFMDTAIVKNGDKNYVIVIFSKTFSGDYDFKAGSELYASITKVVDAAIN